MATTASMRQDGGNSNSNSFTTTQPAATATTTPSSSSNNDRLLNQMRQATQCPTLDSATGLFYLEMCNLDVDLAATYYLQQQQPQQTTTRTSTRSTTSTTSTRSGQCVQCGIRTHTNSRLQSATTNEHVHEGICILCFPQRVPELARRRKLHRDLKDWESKANSGSSSWMMGLLKHASIPSKQKRREARQAILQAFQERSTTLSLHQPRHFFTALPECICLLHNLIQLNCANNQLQSLPNSIGTLPQLKVLLCSHNQLKVLPESIGNLANLEQFNCSHNSIQTLPESLTQLHNVRVLDVSHNQLSVLPDGLDQLGNSLQILQFQHNQIRQLPPSFGQLRQLQKLACYNNHPELGVAHLLPVICGLEHLQEFQFQSKFIYRGYQLEKLLEFAKPVVVVVPTTTLSETEPSLPSILDTGTSVEDPPSSHARRPSAYNPEFLQHLELLQDTILHHCSVEEAPIGQPTVVDLLSSSSNNGAAGTETTTSAAVADDDNAYPLPECNTDKARQQQTATESSKPPSFQPERNPAAEPEHKTTSHRPAENFDKDCATAPPIIDSTHNNHHTMLTADEKEMIQVIELVASALLQAGAIQPATTVNSNNSATLDGEKIPEYSQEAADSSKTPTGGGGENENEDPVFTFETTGSGSDNKSKNLPTKEDPTSTIQPPTPSDNIPDPSATNSNSFDWTHDPTSDNTTTNEDGQMDASSKSLPIPSATTGRTSGQWEDEDNLHQSCPVDLHSISQAPTLDWLFSQVTEELNGIRVFPENKQNNPPGSSSSGKERDLPPQHVSSKKSATTTDDDGIHVYGEIGTDNGRPEGVEESGEFHNDMPDTTKPTNITHDGIRVHAEKDCGGDGMRVQASDSDRLRRLPPETAPSLDWITSQLRRGESLEDIINELSSMLFTPENEKVDRSNDGQNKSSKSAHASGLPTSTAHHVADESTKDDTSAPTRKDNGSPRQDQQQIPAVQKEEMGVADLLGLASSPGNNEDTPTDQEGAPDLLRLNSLLREEPSSSTIPDDLFDIFAEAGYGNQC